MNKVIVLDYNGFIHPNNFADDSTVKYWREILQINEDVISDEELKQNIRNAYVPGRVLWNMELYRTSTDERLNLISLSLCGKPLNRDDVDIHKYMIDYHRSFKLDNKFLDSVYKLKNKYKIYLIANVDRYSVWTLMNNIDYSMFSEVFTSLNLHKRTTDMDFLFKVQSTIREPLREVLFITSDELHYNTAMRFGWNVTLVPYKGYNIIESLLSDGGYK